MKKDFSKLSFEDKKLRVLNCGVMAARKFYTKLTNKKNHGVSMREVNKVLSAHFEIDIPDSPKLHRVIYGHLYMKGWLGSIKDDLKGMPSPVADKIEARIDRTQDWHPFYKSEAWKKLRRNILILYGRRCMCCGQTKGEIHVDHIKPRSLFPEIELDPSNSQILCRQCNEKKSNLHCTDYRPEWAKTYDFTKI